MLIISPRQEKMETLTSTKSVVISCRIIEFGTFVHWLPCIARFSNFTQLDYYCLINNIMFYQVLVFYN